jgi:hypothetical protein
MIEDRLFGKDHFDDAADAGISDYLGDVPPASSALPVDELLTTKSTENSKLNQI